MLHTVPKVGATQQGSIKETSPARHAGASVGTFCVGE